MTTISLKVPAALERGLAEEAERRGTSRSAVIRDALERFIEKNTGRSGSCLAKAAELIGCVDGPADLSHNKKRLAGFGLSAPSAGRTAGLKAGRLAGLWGRKIGR